MSIQVNLHKTHRQHTGGLETVEVEGRTVGNCLHALVNRYPGMGAVLFHSGGKLHHLIEIYLNMESAYPDELKKPVQDGDEIHITVMLSGG
ncbi:MAG: MoaD/ThiS family protein [Pseudomonadota bacterium]